MQKTDTPVEIWRCPRGHGSFGGATTRPFRGPRSQLHCFAPRVRLCASRLRFQPSIGRRPHPSPHDVRRAPHRAPACNRPRSCLERWPWRHLPDWRARRQPLKPTDGTGTQQRVHHCFSQGPVGLSAACGWHHLHRLPMRWRQRARHRRPSSRAPFGCELAAPRARAARAAAAEPHAAYLYRCRPRAAAAAPDAVPVASVVSAHSCSCCTCAVTGQHLVIPVRPRRRSCC
jgi:hypothetical protein